MIEINPSITTIAGNHYKLLKEAEELELKKVSFFPTCLNLEERKSFYKALKKSKIKEIPFVHLRGDDMEVWEVEFFMENYKTGVFNIHDSKYTPKGFNKNLLQYRDVIYVENTPKDDNIESSDLNRFAGICFDTAHYESNRINKKKNCAKWDGFLGRFQVGCIHISAIGSSPNKKGNFDNHLYKNLNEFDYLMRYKEYLNVAIVNSLELENNIEEQLKAKHYLEDVLFG